MVSNGNNLFTLHSLLTLSFYTLCATKGLERACGAHPGANHLDLCISTFPHFHAASSLNSIPEALLSST